MTDQAVPFDCTPYACVPAFGACRSECSTSTDCAPGFVCNGDHCEAAGPTEADDSGCGCRAASSDSGSPIFACLGLALAIAAQRKRRRVAR